MAKRIIRKNDDPVLYKVCKDVKKFDAKLSELIDDMIETMNDADGVGLAAPQIGILRRICVIDVGDGPVDAAFQAIDKLVGQHYELDDFQIRSVTEGREAMGEAVVRLRYNGKLYSGRGISTDIVGSSVRAYLGAVNKIAYENASFMPRPPRTRSC